MKKTVKKNLLITSLLCANLLVIGCKNNYEPNSIVYPTINIDNDYSENKEYEPSTIEITNDVNEDYDSLDFNTDDLNIIKTNNKTPIYNNDKEIIGYFTPEHDFMYLDEDSTNYLINYYGNNGYVDKKDTYQSTKKIINTEMIDKGYVKVETPIYDNYELKDEYATLNKLEFVEIYIELDNCYLVQTIDYVGFIPKDNVGLIEGNLAVVDRSNQELRLYEDNIMTVCTPVVTGTRNTSRESDLGLFTVHTKAENLYIIPGAWVDCVSYYNGGEGIHTACWRTTPEFGGDTYITNGSHGCINTPHDEAMYVHKVLKKGEKVLVKE